MLLQELTRNTVKLELPPNLLYTFTLHGGNEFHGRFKQSVIKARSAYMNGAPFDIAVDTILSIHRVDGPRWLLARRQRYFLFELGEGIKITGVPDEKACLVDIVILQGSSVTSILNDCKVEFENILKVKQVT